LGGGGVVGVRQGEVGECERLYAEVRKMGEKCETEDEKDEANDEGNDEISPKEYAAAPAWGRRSALLGVGSSMREGLVEPLPQTLELEFEWSDELNGGFYNFFFFFFFDMSTQR
jgi:hypothetical protein